MNAPSTAVASACIPRNLCSMARILLIEDDDLLRDVLAQSLIAAGHDVVQASNGEEGVQLFRAAPTDVVVTD